MTDLNFISRNYVEHRACSDLNGGSDYCDYLGISAEDCSTLPCDKELCNGAKTPSFAMIGLAACALMYQYFM